MQIQKRLNRCEPFSHEPIYTAYGPQPIPLVIRNINLPRSYYSLHQLPLNQAIYNSIVDKTRVTSSTRRVIPYCRYCEMDSPYENTPDAVEGSIETLVLVHVACGAAATLLFLPLGVLIPRYGRALTRGRWWFPTHMAVQLIGTILAIVAIATGSNLGGAEGASHSVSTVSRYPVNWVLADEV
jgi:hypothetical protein